jgi:hypothetical protein
MKILIVPLLSLLVLSLPQSSMTQHGGSNKLQATVRSPVRLLPGYKIEFASGVEGGYGVHIWKEAGLNIFGSFGCCFGAKANSVGKDRLGWEEKQEMNGRHVTLAYTKGQDLVVTFTEDNGSYPVNFTAHIRDEHDVAETLLMVLTYEPTHGYPVPPQEIVQAPQQPK